MEEKKAGGRKKANLQKNHPWEACLKGYGLGVAVAYKDLCHGMGQANLEEEGENEGWEKEKKKVRKEGRT